MTAVAQGAPAAAGRMRTHAVRGGGGLRLHVREWGPADGPPILFIHGWSQNHLCWVRQYESGLADEFRLVAYDLRGHGMSEAPLEPEHYSDGQLWADDLAAIIDQLRLDRPVLVGWSYGPFVIGDYLRAHGQDGIAAINFVEGAVKLGEAAFGTLIGPGFLDHFVDATADDLPTNLRAMRSFVRTCLVKPVADEDLETAVAWNVVVPAQVRANLAARELDCDDVLAALEVPPARHPGPGRHGGAAGDGRAHPGHLPDRRGLLVRRRRSRPPPGGPRALQPRAGRPDPTRSRLIRASAVSLSSLSIEVVAAVR
jgi:non-heme chloroperoxidase